MGKPTLLERGQLVAPPGHERQVPIEVIIDWLKRRMAEFGGGAPKKLADRVLIVQSKTGSGKSTVLPAHVLRLLRSALTHERHKLQRAGVMCTQPRVFTAMQIARDMDNDDVNYPDLVLGRTVGYQTGSVNERPARGLIYATSPSLLAQLRSTPDADIMAQYRFIIVDEAHERSLDIDALLMRLKRFLRANLGNPKLPFVLLASATLPVEKYARYFELGPANIMRVEGRTYPIVTRWPARGTNNYPEEAARVAVKIHTDNADDDPTRADILVFMPGAAEIETVVDALLEANRAFRRPGAAVPPFDVLKLDSAVVQSQGRDFIKVKADPSRLRIPSLDGATMLRPLRRILVSTVVAETGLTIETLGYVIDGGWNRSSESYYPGGFRGVITRPAPKSRIKQRMGRSGRKFAGEFHPLYTQNVYNALPDEQMPDIVTEGVAPIFLDVVVCASGADRAAGSTQVASASGAGSGVFRLEDIDMLDAPPTDALAAALEQAIAFGFLRPAVERVTLEKLPPVTVDRVAGHELTPLGELASKFHRLHMPQAQILLAGYLWRVSLQDLALVAALYDARDPLVYPAPPADVKAAKDKALAAGLPECLRALRGDPKAARALVRDDFLEALLVFGAFGSALDATQGEIARLADWCDANGVDLGGAALLASYRDEVMSELVATGLNPFWGAEYRLREAATVAEFRDTVVRLKHCIYAGLRFSTLVLGGGGRYYAAGRRAVEVGGAFDGLPADAPRPRHFVTNEVRIRGVPRTARDRYPPMMYRLVPGLVSVTDGFVDVDPAALAPRHK